MVEGPRETERNPSPNGVITPGATVQGVQEKSSCSVFSRWGHLQPTVCPTLFLGTPSLSLLLFAALLLVSQGVESNPGPGEVFPCAVCNSPVSWRGVSFLCTICQKWCHRRCCNIDTRQEYLRLSPWCCPGCSVPRAPSISSGSTSNSSSLSSSASYRTALASLSSSLASSETTSASDSQIPLTRILQLNCNGLNSSHTEIAAFLTEKNISIACLQETKLSTRSTLKPFPGYTPIRQDRDTGRGGGGLLTLIREDLHFATWDTSSLFPGDHSAEVLGTEVHLGGLPLRVANIYIPPCTSCPAGYQTKFDSLFNSSSNNTILLGDLNAHHPSWYSATNDDRAAARGTALDNSISNSDICILNEDSPTRLPKHGPPSSPDLSLISSHLYFDTTWETQIRLNSDHLPILIELSGLQSTPPHRSRKTFTNFKKANWTRFREETEELFHQAPPPTLCSRGEKSFRNILKEASRHNIPAGYIRDEVPSIPPEASPLIKERDALRSANPQDPRIPILDTSIHESIRKHNLIKWQNLLNASNRATNPTKYWSLLRKLSGKRSKQPPNQSISFSNTTCTQSNHIAAAFNKQFTSIVTRNSDPNTRVILRQIRNKCKTAQPPIFTTEEVQKAITRSGNSSAIGPDGLTMLHIKHLGPEGITYLTKLFNISLANSDIPAIWKESLIIPIPKPGKPKDQGNSYRPISLLCPPIKVLERLLLPHLTDSLLTQQTQHGFKPHHSTVTALIPITTDIVNGFNQKRPPHRTIAVAIDISKAFDSVNHTLLLQMILHSTLNPLITRWLAAYIRGRKAACVYLNNISPFRGVPAGVPQGSVISPALFNYFISDCPIPNSNITSYADDLTIWTSSPDIQEAESTINGLLDDITTWTIAKRLTIAPSKSSSTLFTPDTHQSNYQPQVFIQNSLVPLNKTPKILGVTLDTHLTFAPHINTIHTRASSTINILRSLTSTTWGFTKENIISTYKALTRPIINYAAPIWFPNLATSRLQKVESIQNSALRTATGCLRMSSIDHLHTESSIFPLRTHLDLCCLQYLASSRDPEHPNWLHTSPRITRPRPMKHLLQSKYHNFLTTTINQPTQLLFEDSLIHANYPTAKTRLRDHAIVHTIDQRTNNRILMAPPPDVDNSEQLLPRPHRVTLAQMRSGFCFHLATYKNRIDPTAPSTCPDCHSTDHTATHIFNCPQHPTHLAPADLWSSPLEAASFIVTLPSFSSLPTLPFMGQPPP